jgi:hypothetical protein
MFAQINEGPDGSNGELGFGLPLVRSLAAMHGGSVEASSGGIGMGATYVLRLPVSESARFQRSGCGKRSPQNPDDAIYPSTPTVTALRRRCAYDRFFATL